MDEDDELGHVVRFGELTVVVEGAAVDVTVIKDGSPATVDVGADETVAVAVSLPFDEVEADGRFDITLPAST